MTKLRLKVLLGVAGVVGTLVGAQAIVNTAGAAEIQVAQATPAAPAATDDAAAIAALVATGQPIYHRNCEPCHGDQGQGGIGEVLQNSPIAHTAGGIINQILIGSVEHGMPPFAGTLSNDQIAAVATYVRNSFGNDFGIVTPDEVQNARGG